MTKMTQAALWILFLGPWLILPLFDTRRVRRFLSAALFTTVLTTIAWQAAPVFNWWVTDENLPFLSNISAFNFGMLPVLSLLVFYFTYPNAWLFFGTNIVIEAIQAFIISPYVFMKLRFYHMAQMSNTGLFIMLLCFPPIIYVYQLWYERRPEFSADPAF